MFRFLTHPVTWTLGLFLIAGGAGTVSAEEPLPKPLPASRYEKLATHSPFAPPTNAPAVAQPTPPPPPPIFDKYTVALLTQQGADYTATLNNKETSEHSRVSMHADNEEGIRLSSVQWANNPNETKVTLEKSGAFGTIGFDPNGVAAAAAAPNPVVPQRPNNIRPIPPNPGAFRPPPGVVPNPNQPSNPNAVRRGAIIRSPGNVRPTPRPGQPGVNFTNSPRVPGPPIPGNRLPASKSAEDDDDDE